MCAQPPSEGVDLHRIAVFLRLLVVIKITVQSPGSQSVPCFGISEETFVPWCTQHQRPRGDAHLPLIFAHTATELGFDFKLFNLNKGFVLKSLGFVAPLEQYHTDIQRII